MRGGHTIQETLAFADWCGTWEDQEAGGSTPGRYPGAVIGLNIREPGPVARFLRRLRSPG